MIEFRACIDVDDLDKAEQTVDNLAAQRVSTQ